MGEMASKRAVAGTLFFAGCVFGFPVLPAGPPLPKMPEEFVEVGRLRSPVNLPLYFQGRLVGTAVASAGTRVDVHGEQDGGLKIAISGNSFLVQSDSVERSGERRRVSRMERLEARPDGRANFPKGPATAPGLPTGRENFPPIVPKREREVLHLTNLERAKVGVRPLVWNEDLARAARYHAADMAHDAYFDHGSFDRRDGRLVRLGIEFARIRRFDSKGSAENIALMATDSAEEVVRRWMESSSHRHNILNPANVKVGIGFCAGYWVQDFGW
jgi:uncharacterized protein YkwD